MLFIDIYEMFPIVDGESPVPLSEEKREWIRRQVKLDWSKRFVTNATIEHLDVEAIAIAREKYKEAVAHLRGHKLIEGRINNLYL